MVRTYKKKGREPPSNDNVLKALTLIREGETYRSASVQSGIPIGTLHSYKKKQEMKKKVLVQKKGRQLGIPEKIETHVVKAIQAAADLGWPFDVKDVQELFGIIVEELSLVTQFKNGFPAKDYVKQFLKRNKTKLSLRKVEILKKQRAEAESPEIVDNFIETVDKAYKLAKIDDKKLADATRVLNIDETAFSTTASTKKLIVSRGGQASIVAPNEGKTCFTVLWTGSAAGHHFPPYTVLKGSETTIPANWVLNGPKGGAFTTSPNGWMDGARFLQYISWLNSEIIAAKVEKPVVIIMDGFSGHISLKIIEEARKNELILVKLPPNSTHYLQALDVAVFGPMKKIWAGITRKFYRQSQNKPITKSVFPVLLSSLMEKVQQEGTRNLVSGFRATGVWPLDKEHVLKRLEKKHGLKGEVADCSNSKSRPVPSLIEVGHQVNDSDHDQDKDSSPSLNF